MPATDAANLAVRGRWAVAAAFFMNGFLTGSWAPQIPVFLTRLQISEFTLGILILLFGVGAVSAMTLCGYLIARNGARSVTRWMGFAAMFGLLLVALAPNVPLAALAMIFFGGTIGGMDVAMNANGVIVEKKLARAIMSSLHGFWSLGGFAGGAIGGIAIQTYGHLPHAIGVTLVAMAIGAWALANLYPDEVAPSAAKTRIGLPRHLNVYLVGFMALFCMIPEGAVLDWAAIYLRQELEADIAVAGFAYAGFAGTMACIRFLGDAVRNRFGAVRTMRVSALIAASGMLVAGLAPSSTVAIAAFAFCGLGIANMVPIAFSAAGNQKGLSSGAGMSVVTTMGYSGILMAPSAIGFVGGGTGFSAVFIALSGLLVIVFLMAGLAHTADFDTDKQPH
jgi:predicted MFS family arabinose efflux permease